MASVSRIELLTKTDADEYAYLYRISGGEEQGIEPAARPVGTTITVRDLVLQYARTYEVFEKGYQ